jgi:hypothetical protein
MILGGSFRTELAFDATILPRPRRTNRAALIKQAFWSLFLLPVWGEEVEGEVVRVVVSAWVEDDAIGSVHRIRMKYLRIFLHNTAQKGWQDVAVHRIHLYFSDVIPAFSRHLYNRAHVLERIELPFWGFEVFPLICVFILSSSIIFSFYILIVLA